jgi:hypothetical protein
MLKQTAFGAVLLSCLLEGYKMTLRLIILAALLSLTGCSTQYFRTSPVANEVQTATVGSAIVQWVYGHEMAGLAVDEQKKGLFYSGVDHDVVLVSYRQIQSATSPNGIAWGLQPVSTSDQELHYDVSKNREITFQDMTIEVMSATPSNLTYKIVKGPSSMETGERW